MNVSVMQPVANINFPHFMGTQVYMHEVDFANPVLPPNAAGWEEAFEQMILVAHSAGCTEGKGWVTIDQRVVEEGKSHRRPGRHVDGNYLFSWGSGGGNGWLTGDAGRQLSPEQHAQQYCSREGGIIIASSYAACKAWNGTWEGTPAQGGDCTHIDVSGLEEFMLEPNKIYLGNHAIHESLPVQETVQRSLIRLTLPHTFHVA